MFRSSGLNDYGEWVCEGEIDGIRFQGCVGKSGVIWVPYSPRKTEIAQETIRAIEVSIWDEFKRNPNGKY